MGHAAEPAAPSGRAAAPAGRGRAALPVEDRRADAEAQALRFPAGRASARPAAGPAARPAARPADEVPGRDGARDGVVSDRLADRLAERTAMARHRFWRRLGGTVATVAVLAGLGWAAFFSPLLALDPDQVRITGQGTTVDVEQVRDAVTAEAGVPLPRLDTVGLREEILGLNAVKNVRIERVWPDGLAVTLTSREPVAAVPESGGRFALMDADGVRVATAKEVPEGLPSIVVSLSDGDVGHRAMDAALAVLGALPARLASDISTVSAATQDDVRTTLSDGRVIRWGSGDDVELKTRVAQALLRAEPSARTIDVSSPALPVTN
ncbi:cell division protein FtsQ [Promicromonospora thailandica]|uniref:Cell division protein FtsQ n=1 Tax=Promicromonospora thailandica TaxID=765201 RepID=A0A9X2FZF7_9MICO|nr:cell division protein FtsQ/DivIB [Promicromonospora thailandica]MCP2263999.1 cell division protein FtsQ [Promicromonospora thailandica]BFF17667.1 cell division protein FtsQ [Promicromonospora thailandica]